jgi:outer membrane protein insertion porin family
LGLTYSLIQDDTEIADAFVDIGGGTIVEQCDETNVARPVLCDQEGSFITSVLGYSYNLDRRNQPVRPTRGFDLSVSQDVAGLGGEVNYIRTEIEGGLYYGLWGGFRATLRANAGYIAGWRGDDVRINDRFFKGGSSFRGFDVAGIGPRQLLVDDVTGAIVETGDAVGGNAFAIGTLQLDIPVPLPESFGVGGALFVDFGTLGTLDSANRRTVDLTGANRLIIDDTPSLRAAAGLSVFWDSPFGPVQFDLAQPLEYEEYDRTEEFRFSTRTNF